jgi:hypothetical protein
VLTSDGLRSDSGATLGAVRSFLGLPPAPTPAPREVHVGRQMPYPSKLMPEDLAWLRSVYAEDAERLAALTGLRFG